MLVDATQIAAAQGDAVPIEEFQDLDRDLASVVDRSRNCAAVNWPFGAFAAMSMHDLDHLGDGAAQEEMVLRDFVAPFPSGRAASAAAAHRPRDARARRQCRGPAADGNALRRQAAERSCARASRPAS